MLFTRIILHLDKYPGAFYIHPVWTVPKKKTPPGKKNTIKCATVRRVGVRGDRARGSFRSYLRGFRGGGDISPCRVSGARGNTNTRLRRRLLLLQTHVGLWPADRLTQRNPVLARGVRVWARWCAPPPAVHWYTVYRKRGLSRRRFREFSEAPGFRDSCKYNDVWNIWILLLHGTHQYCTT